MITYSKGFKEEKLRLSDKIDEWCAAALNQRTNRRTRVVAVSRTVTLLRRWLVAST